MVMSYIVTDVKDAYSGQIFILRYTELDENGEPTGGVTTEQLNVQAIIGSPEGRAVGSPGDIRFRIDVPQIWIKVTGVRTITGWELVGPGGGGITLCDSTPQPIQGGSVGAPGIDGEAARCDHEHPVPVAAPITVVGAVNAEGTETTLARSDHQHRLELGVQELGVAVGSRPAINFVGATVTDDPGNDRVNITIAGASPGGAPNALAVGQAGAAGISALYARVDHDHAVPAGAPITVTGGTNAAGASTNFTRSDHQHRLEVGVQSAGVAIGARPTLNFIGATVADDVGNDRVNITIPTAASPGGVPDSLDVGQVGAAGVSLLYAREDHVHAVPAGTPVTVGTANAAGAAATFARSDHVHRTVLQWQSAGVFVAARPIVNVTGAGAPTITENIPQDRVTLDFPGGPSAAAPDGLDVGQVGAAGVSPLFSRADHVHAVPAGTPVTVTGSTNSDGVATTFARSDHQHALAMTAQDEGVAVGSRAIFNFIGAGVVATDDPGNNRVNITIDGAAAATWAATLVAGNVSGGTDPVISTTDTLRGVDSAAAGTNGGPLNLRAGNYTGAGAGVDIGGAFSLRGGSTNATGNGSHLPDNLIAGGDHSGASTARAGALLVRGGDRTNGNGQTGSITVRAGNGSAAGGTAGTLLVQGATLTNSGNLSGSATFAGGDNFNSSTTSGGGFALVRGGDAPAVGAGANSNAGHLNLRGGNYRTGLGGSTSSPGDVYIRSGQLDASAGSTAGTTGIIRLTTNANLAIGDMPTVSGASTVTGNIQIDTIGPGATGSSTGDITIQTGSTNNPAASAPGDIAITAGAQLNAGASGFNNGGDVNITCGNNASTSNSTRGGLFAVVAGNTAGGTTSPGGAISLTAGNQTGTGTSANSPGGSVSLIAGSSAKSAASSGGGVVLITAGATSGAASPGGSVSITAGNNTNAAATASAGGIAVTAGSVTVGGTGAGGDLSLTAGSAAGTGAGGDVDVVAGNSTVELTRGAFTYRSGIDGSGSEVRNKTRVVQSGAGATTTVNLASIGAVNERTLMLTLRVAGQNTTTAGEVCSRTFMVTFNRTGGVTALATTDFDSALQTTAGWAPGIAVGNTGDTIQVTVGGGINPVPAAANWSMHWSTQLGGMAP